MMLARATLECPGCMVLAPGGSYLGWLPRGLFPELEGIMASNPTTPLALSA